MLTKYFNPLLTITLTEQDKRVLVIIFLLFLLIVLVIGLLSRLEKFLMKKEGEELDKYLRGYVKYGFVTTEKEYKKVANQKNHALLIKQMYIPLLILIVNIIILSLFCTFARKNWLYIFDIYNDMGIRLDVDTTIVLGFLPIWSDWPHITEDSLIFHGSVEAIFAYIFLIIFIVGFYLLCRCTFKYIARQKRIKIKIQSIFIDSAPEEVLIDNQDKVEKPKE